MTARWIAVTTGTWAAMAERGMFATTDLAPHLAQRGITLSTSQVHRLVTGTPERLSLPVLAALCDILDCEPGDLVEPVVEVRQARKAAAAGEPAVKPAAKGRRPDQGPHPAGRRVAVRLCRRCGSEYTVDAPTKARSLCDGCRAK